MKKQRPSILTTLDRLAAAERGFLDAEFLAPVLAGHGVQVRIASIRCRLRAEPGEFEGWGVFRPASHSIARLVRPASLAERRRYLALFPAVGLVLVRPDAADGTHAAPTWLAVPAHAADGRFRIEGLVPVRLVDEPDRFDTVRARFDGSQFWYEEADARADPGAAAHLRQALAAMTDPAAADSPGLTAEQRRAYAVEHGIRRQAEEDRRQAAEDRRRAEADRARRRTERAERLRARTGEERVRAALAHAGADLLDVAERGDVYRITYSVDGRRHTSVVGRGDLAVQTAGICLSGGDAAFDLHSLVGVIREGERGGAVVRTL